MAKKAFKELIDNVPYDKLTDFPGGPKTIYKTEKMRLDVQGTTNNGLRNIQVQPNSGHLQEYGRKSFAVVQATPNAHPGHVGVALASSYNKDGASYTVDKKGVYKTKKTKKTKKG